MSEAVPRNGPYHGSCACGQVTVDIEGEPAGPFQCLCVQCRRASGGGPAIFLAVPRQAFTVSGPLLSFAEPTGSGNSAWRHACAHCGTPVYSQGANSPDSRFVKLGMFPNGPWDRVKAIFWLSEAPAWFCLDPDVPGHPTQP